jgi:hypothetical protein
MADFFAKPLQGSKRFWDLVVNVYPSLDTPEDRRSVLRNGPTNENDLHTSEEWTVVRRRRRRNGEVV